MKELSDAIYAHLIKVARNTKLQDKVEDKGNKSMVASAPAAAMKKNQAALVQLAGTPEEFVEINGHLFFFFNPATIVRWPKPNLEFKDFTVRIEPRVKDLEKVLNDKGASQTKLTSLKMTGFVGDFWIDEDGTLHIVQPAPETGGIDIVLLGNPGPELGTNSPC